MAEQTKIVKGGFRAALALITSITALVLSILAYNRTPDQTMLSAEIQKFETKINEMRKETSAQVDKIRQEPLKGLKKIDRAIRKEDGKA